MKKTIVTILLLFLIVTCSACYVKVGEDFYIEQAKPLVVTIGDKILLDNITYDENNDTIIKKEDGIYANKIGDIVVKSNKEIYYITVVEEEVIINASADLLLSVGENSKITSVVLPQGKDQTVVYESTDTEVISVNEDGIVFALSVGIARVKVKSLIYNSVTELNFVVMEEDEEYYVPIINNIISSNNQNINFDDNKGILQGIINYNSMSLIGVKSYTYKNDSLIENNTGCGVIYKMNIHYIDGSVKEDVKTLENEKDIKHFEYYVITNNHLVINQSAYKVHLGENIPDAEAELVQYDSKIDLAVIKFKSRYYFPTCKIGNSDDLEKGDFIISIGSGHNFTTLNTPTFGIISATERYIGTDTDYDGVKDWDAKYIQHDAASNDNDSGSIIVNLKGEVVGINSTKIGDIKYNNMTFAIPMNLVMEIVAQLEKGNRPQRATLGVQILDVYDYNLSPNDFLLIYPNMKVPEGLKYGFYVSGVDKGGLADKGGVKVGDIIVAFNNVEVKYSYQLRAELGKFLFGSGDVVEVKVIRNNELITLYITF